MVTGLATARISPRAFPKRFPKMSVLHDLQVDGQEETRCSQRVSFVERTGIEPVTFGLQSRRSPS
jgi:hypothetical protein